jgi:hypothetical protein
MKSTKLKTKIAESKVVKAKSIKTTKPAKKENLIGKYVIVRSHMAGVFFGILSAKNNNELTLKNARKLYYFSGANTVEDLAMQGALNGKECKFTVFVPTIVIGSFEQILPCTEVAISNIKSIQLWTVPKNKD